MTRVENGEVGMHKTATLEFVQKVLLVLVLAVLSRFIHHR